MTNDNEFLWNQFIKLGDMMGDGLHYEPDGKWITREYKKLSKILCPPTEEEKQIQKEQRKNKNAQIDSQIAEKLKVDKCPLCSGELTQSRSGSLIVKCIPCGKRFKYKTRKNGK